VLVDGLLLLVFAGCSELLLQAETKSKQAKRVQRLKRARIVLICNLMIPPKFKERRIEARISHFVRRCLILLHITDAFPFKRN
jgi:hypothetical protein